eukprot:UN01530
MATIAKVDSNEIVMLYWQTFQWVGNSQAVHLLVTFELRQSIALCDPIYDDSLFATQRALNLNRYVNIVEQYNAIKTIITALKKTI